MTLGSALAGIALIGLAWVHTLWQFYALWSGVLGLATALILYPVSFTVVTNWFERRRGKALAVLTLLGGLASPIFVPFAGWLVLHLGWRGPSSCLVCCSYALLSRYMALCCGATRRTWASPQTGNAPSLCDQRCRCLVRHYRRRCVDLFSGRLPPCCLWR